MGYGALLNVVPYIRTLCDLKDDYIGVELWRIVGEKTGIWHRPAGGSAAVQLGNWGSSITQLSCVK
jgi:hypothetical protein